MAWRVNVKFHSPNWRVDFFTLRMHIWNFHDIKGQKSISFKNENSKILQLQGASPLTPYIKSLILKRWKTWHFLHQVLCPPIDICSHWQGLFMIEGVFLYWPVFKLPRIAGIERGIFVTCDKWRYDTLKIMEMRAIFTQKMVFQVYNRFQELKQSRNSLELFMARISTILLCIFMYHIWKKILCLYLQFATNQQTACRYLKKCALEGLLNTGRYRVIKRLNVIVLPTWTFQNSSASRERPLTPFRYKLSLLHFKMKEMNFS